MVDRRIRAGTCALVLCGALVAGALGWAGCGGDGGAGADPATASPATTPTGAPSPGTATPATGAAPADASSPDADAGIVAMKMPAFVVGYNEAWFGPHFGTGLTTAFDPAYVDAVLDGIVAGGGHVVRLWLFELMQGVTLGASTPQTQSVSAQMIDNLEAVLVAARKRGLWVYLTALEGNQMSKVPHLKDYYANLVNDVQGEGAAFQTNVLGPLLAMLDRHTDNVFGLDLVNEIDAPKKDGVWPGYPLDTSAPRAFIQRTRSFLKSRSPWLRVTATMGLGGTAQFEIAAGFLSGLGLDFYDLHVYSDDGTFPGATALCNRAKSDGVPIYLGEFGQKTKTWDDQLHYDATAAFVSNAKSLCFAGAFAWRFDSHEETWAYQRPDGGFRPAVQIMQLFGQ